MPSKTMIKPDSAKQSTILSAAVEIFAREGFRGTDVQEIADRAGVGKGTVYRYFGDKQELFWDTVYWVLDKMDGYLAEKMSGEMRPLEKLRAACRAYGEFFQENPEYLEIFVLDRAEFRGTAPPERVERHEKMIAEFGKIIEAGISMGEIRPVDPRDVVVALGGTLHGAVVTWAYVKVDRSLAEMTEYTADIFLAGIRADKP
jgi:AcrR family transcriptional regulator